MTGNSGFWKNFLDLDRPFIGLSPMDGITDAPFRAITAKYGRPDLTFTEFIAVEALIRGVQKSFEDLRFTELERPIVAQLYGKDPELFYSCAQIIAELGFDGVDINMGCPAKTVEARGAGAGLMKTPDLAVEIIEAVEDGLAGWVKNGIEYDKWPEEIKFAKVKRFFSERKKSEGENNKQRNKNREMIPISVKTRIGYDKPMLDEWFGPLSKTNVKAFSIHGRTFKQKYSGRADWDVISEASKYIKNINKDAIVIGNGDISSYKEGIDMAKKYNVDGVLIGRKSIGNPWVVRRDGQVKVGAKTSELFDVMLEHSKLHYELKGPRAFVQMRRTLAEYIKEIPNAAQIRSELVRVNNPQEVEQILDKNLSH